MNKIDKSFKDHAREAFNKSKTNKSKFTAETKRPRVLSKKTRSILAQEMASMESGMFCGGRNMRSH